MTGGATAMERLLVLVRHGQSEWNLQNLFTGWRDPDLTERGVAEARAAGRGLKRDGYGFDVAFTSELVRAQRTCALILEEMSLSEIPVLRARALNERDYGDLSGLNKDEARARWEAARAAVADHLADVLLGALSDIPGLAELVADGQALQREGVHGSLDVGPVHGDAGDGGLERHARIHHRQTAPAHRRHRRRAV